MSEDEIVTVRTRAQLRKWLEENHNVKTGNVWLATYKKHHRDYLPWIEAVEELLCWGWVDAQVAGLDADRMRHRIAPRKETSAWSAVNKDIVTRMHASGQMTPAGEAKIAAAEANGMWEFLDDVERLEVPEDLASALGPSRKTWDDYPRSVKRGTLEWIKTAKTAPTRTRRIDDVAQSAAAGLRPSIFRK
ncbi:YdeI family protein [Gymnodinialimonas hymeniacidonis]|uniref:YdeI/OmpD-associated family protein n=1 Tax=Gymnodinialimonas hymeniacidonis TaxID=3126508 RepID=UPI0034C60D9D